MRTHPRAHPRAGAATLIDLLRLRASSPCRGPGYVFLRDGESDEQPCTWAELDTRARVVAARLQAHDGLGERALVLSPPGLDFLAAFFGCLYPGVRGVPPLGIECSGLVSAVGAEVTECRPGEEVLAVAPFSFGSHALTSALAVVRKPERLSFAEVATIPIAFLTAYYALHHLARLQPGERVLIHAGAGGVSQAALQVGRHAGAEVFATAGSPEKRAFLREQGVAHVFDSRSLAFADEVRAEQPQAARDGLARQRVEHHIHARAAGDGAYGRFLEIGKTDILPEPPARPGAVPEQPVLLRHRPRRPAARAARPGARALPRHHEALRGGPLSTAAHDHVPARPLPHRLPLHGQPPQHRQGGAERGRGAWRRGQRHPQ